MVDFSPVPRKPPRKKRHLPTERVRIRAKNPQIGRRLSKASESETVIGDAEDYAVPPPVRVATMMDEDATEIADGPPPIPMEDLVVRGRIHEGNTPTTPQARPRAHMGMMGTKGAGALAAQVRVQRIANEATPTDIPELRLARAHLSREQIEALDAALSGTGERRDLNAASASPKRSIERLINDHDYVELPIEDRAKILGAIATDPQAVETSVAALKLVQTGQLKKLDPGDRAQLLDIFVALSVPERRALAAFAARKVRGVSALTDRDYQNSTVISHIHALCRSGRLSELMAGAGVKKKHVVGALIAALARPVALPIEHGGDGILGIFEFGLAECSPAELGRIWRSLVTGGMHADAGKHHSLTIHQMG